MDGGAEGATAVGGGGSGGSPTAEERASADRRPRGSLVFTFAGGPKSRLKKLSVKAGGWGVGGGG